MTLRLEPREYLQAADILRRGGIVAFPTETVYGLGGDATLPSAIAAIFEAKGRPSDNPLIVHLGSPDQLTDCCRQIPSLAYSLMDAFCPGPLTLVLPKKPIILDRVTASLPSVAVRFPAHETARKLLLAADRPIAAPSANRSGSPSATRWEAVLEDLDGRIDAVLCDRAAEIGLESTVVDLTSPTPIILRHGAITLEQLRAIEANFATAAPELSTTVNSPGLRHRHYQPRARVYLCESHPYFDRKKEPMRRAWIGLTDLSPDRDRFALIQACSTVDEYARSLYEYFRHCDALQIDEIYCQAVTEAGLGRALMDRLRRAAQPPA